MTSGGLLGNYKGKGTWYESNGDTADYDVTQSISSTPDGLEVVFEHAHTGGTTPKLTLTLKSVVHNIYHVHVADQVVGHGFHFHNTLRFHFNNKHFKSDLDSVTELSFRLTDSDTLEVFGSSTANSAGNYIMWREELSRT